MSEMINDLVAAPPSVAAPSASGAVSTPTPTPAPQNVQRASRGARDAALSGVLAEPAQFFPTANGGERGTARLAVTTPGFTFDRGGQEVTRAATTHYHSVSVFGAEAVAALKAMQPGDPIFVRGSLDAYTSKSTNRPVIAMRAFEVSRESPPGFDERPNRVSIAGEITASQFRQNIGNRQLDSVNYTVRAFGREPKDFAVREYGEGAQEIAQERAVGAKVALDGRLTVVSFQGRSGKVVSYHISTTPREVERIDNGLDGERALAQESSAPMHESPALAQESSDVSHENVEQVESDRLPAMSIENIEASAQAFADDVRRHTPGAFVAFRNALREGNAFGASPLAEELRDGYSRAVAQRMSDDGQAQDFMDMTTVAQELAAKSGTELRALLGDDAPKALSPQLIIGLATELDRVAALSDTAREAERSAALRGTPVEEVAPSQQRDATLAGRLSMAADAFLETGNYWAFRNQGVYPEMARLAGQDRFVGMTPGDMNASLRGFIVAARGEVEAYGALRDQRGGELPPAVTEQARTNLHYLARVSAVLATEPVQATITERHNAAFERLMADRFGAGYQVDGAQTPYERYLASGAAAADLAPRAAAKDGVTVQPVEMALQAIGAAGGEIADGLTVPQEQTHGIMEDGADLTLDNEQVAALGMGEEGMTL